MSQNKKKELLLKYTAGIIASISMTGFGCIMSWSSPALPYLTSEGSYLPTTDAQSDLIASLLTIGFVIGYLLSPLIIDRLGRKRALLMCSPMQIASWLLIIFANNHMTIYVARLTGGIGFGIASCALTVYLSEISDQNNRAIFLVFLSLSRGIGTLIVMLLGIYSSYTIMNYVLLIVPSTFVILFPFVPDSLHFSEKVQQKEDEMTDLMKLKELRATDLEENLAVIKDIKTKSWKLKETALWKLFSLRNNRRAFIITISFVGLDVFSGHMPTEFFTQKILTSNSTILEPEKGALILAGVKIIASLISTQVVERVRRKTLVLTTGLIAAVAQGLVGTFFFLEKLNFDVSFIAWLPLFVLTVYAVVMYIGIFNFSYFSLGELYTADVKAVAVTMTKCSFMIFSYLCLFRFNEINSIIGSHVIFWIFSACCFIGTCISFYIMPETQGKTLEEIQIALKSRKKYCFW